MENKIILTDCDGVLLNWVDQFHKWMKNEGYVKVESKNGSMYTMETYYPFLKYEIKSVIADFNKSSWMVGLEPIENAKRCISRLADNGYRFVVITSIGNGEYIQELRRINLEKVFGNIFEDIICVEIGKGKSSELEKYNGTGYWWIEDDWRNAVAGADVGLNPIIMDYSYNQDNHDYRVRRVYDWDEIVDIIL